MRTEWRWLAWVGVLWCAVVPGRSWAQVEVPMPSPAVSCLTKGESEQPEYPKASLLRKDGGTVKLELTFERADRPPEVKILDADASEATRSLSEATLRHVAGFRLPCLAAGAPPVVLRQDYVFVPNDGRKVMSTVPVDQAKKKDDSSCIRHEAGSLRPEYPATSLRAGVSGNVYVELKFTSPTTAPEIKILAKQSDILAEAVRAHAEGLRMPCQTGEPHSTSMLFHFILEERPRLVLKDLSLIPFLKSVQHLPPAYFDFNTMGCPFDLRVNYMQPYRANFVGQLETPRPERQALLDWLSGLRLNLEEADNTSVLGDTFTLRVPCLILNL